MTATQLNVFLYFPQSSWTCSAIRVPGSSVGFGVRSRIVRGS
jgi:hypothetical protein